MSTVKMAAVGDNLVDRYLDDQIMYPGGSAANAAAFGARLGMPTGYIGVRGDDAEGEHIHRALHHEGVDLTRMRVVTAPTSLTDVRIDAHGNREFVRYLPMTTPIILDADDLHYLSHYDWVHTGHTSGIETQIAALAQHTSIGFDFSDRRMDYAAELLPYLTFATFSGENLSTEDALDLAHTATRAGARYAIITRGAHPIIATTPSTTTIHPIDPIDPIDTLGAGDAFQVAFEKTITEGHPLDHALTTAATFAATICTTPGAFGHPTPLTPECADSRAQANRGR